MDFSSYYHQKIHTLNCIIHNLNNQITQLNLQLQTERLEKEWYKSNPQQDQLQKGETETQTDSVYLCETISQTENNDDTKKSSLQEILIQTDQQPVLCENSTETDQQPVLCEISTETDNETVLHQVSTQTKKLSLKETLIQTEIEAHQQPVLHEISTQTPEQQQINDHHEEENIQTIPKKRQNKSRAFSKVQSKN